MNRAVAFPARPLRGRVGVVVIGAGHSGLAMSRCLAGRSIDHVVIERGEVAHAWRHERWDSLRLLTPNWQARLPGFAYRGDDPDGFMDMRQIVDFLAAYAHHIDAPVHGGTTVQSVRAHGDGYRVHTDRGDWLGRCVVLASGAARLPLVPSVAAALPSSIVQLTTRDYRNPAQLPAGGVLVVGAAASGVQLAEEIHRSGREVTLAVGEHVRMPRHYRGRDIQWWMDAAGVLDERYDALDDIGRARNVASPQLVGDRRRTLLDLNALRALGVRVVGRVAGVADGRLQFSGSLANHCALADLKLGRLLERIDAWAAERIGDAPLPAPERFAPTVVDRNPCLGLDLRSGAIRTVLWATGYRPDWSWLDVPVLDRKGRLRHDGGVVDAPGLYAMGLGFMRRRRSSFIHGAAADAGELADHLHGFLAGAARPAA